MTDPDADPALRALEKAAAQASDAAADLLASVTGMGRSIRAAHAAGHPIAGIGRELWRGRARALHHRAQNRIPPSVRLAAHSAEVLTAAAACGFSDVRVFGSCVHGTDTLASDVDLLVGTGPHTSLLDLAGFVIAVADLLCLPEDRVDVFEDDVLRTDSALRARIAREMQPLAAWAAGWPRLDSLPGWVAAASEEELIEVAESGLHPWGETAAALRNLPAGRPAGATLVDPDEFVRVTAVIAAYAAARAAGLDHDAALTHAVTRD